MVAKPLLVKRLVAVLTLDCWVSGMRLALVVSQALLSESPEGAARVITMQDILVSSEHTDTHILLK